MKNKVDKIVVLLFIVTMCFLMTISAHAETENSYFLTSASLPSKIELNGVTLTPSNTSNNPEMFKEEPFGVEYGDWYSSSYAEVVAVMNIE